MRIYHVMMLFGIFGYQAICCGYNANAKKTIVPISIANKKQSEKASLPYWARVAGVALPSVATTVVAGGAIEFWTHWYSRMRNGQGKFDWGRFGYDAARENFAISAILSAMAVVGFGVSRYAYTRLFPKEKVEKKCEARNV
jgi:hypothetical protein